MTLDPTITNLVIWALFGLGVGTVVHVIDPGKAKGGITGTMLLGVLGALVGGLLSEIIFGYPVKTLSIQGFTTAVIGGLILAFMYRLLFRNTDHIRTTTRSMKQGEEI